MRLIRTYVLSLLVLDCTCRSTFEIWKVVMCRWFANWSIWQFWRQCVVQWSMRARGVDLGGEGRWGRLVCTWLQVTTQSTGCRKPCRLGWHETPNTARAAKHRRQNRALNHNRRKRLGDCARNGLAVSSLLNDIVSSTWHHRRQTFLAICQFVEIKHLNRNFAVCNTNPG